MSLCEQCNKTFKKPYTYTPCKCGYDYCNACLFPERHFCRFDYKAEHKKKLENANVKVVKSKISNKLE